MKIFTTVKEKEYYLQQNRLTTDLLNMSNGSQNATEQNVQCAE